MSFIDAHLHLQDPRLEASLESIISQLKQSGISHWVINGTSPDDWGKVGELARENSQVIAGYGLHPWKVNEFGTDGLDTLESFLIADPKAIVGEIGLDKWIRDHDIALQKKCFIKQLEMANRNSRSTAVHCLQSWGHLRECLKEVSPAKPFLLHSYGGPREMVYDFLELGAFFSISGYFFRPDKVSKLAVFDEVPFDRILVESDAPDMLPPGELIKVPLDEGLNHPVNLVRIYEAFAEHLSLSINEVVDQMGENFATWYQTKARSSADERSAIE